MKNIAFVKRDGPRHWVGNGFPVRSVFSYNDIAAEMSPFLLLDYGGPAEFTPTNERRGVGEHPHRGFETVTIVYDGEVEHRDSTGGGGTIGRGDVQWMTAASGVVHQEYHGAGFAKRGGRFEMIQLWINLAAKDKMAKPRYQNIPDASIPNLALENGGSVRVIAGAYDDAKGPAKTFSEMNVWDVTLNAGTNQVLPALDKHTTALFVLRGKLRTEAETVSAGELAVFERSGADVEVYALEETRLLFLSGAPIEEPIVAYGPFVMNTRAEIQQAIVDYQSGRMGNIQAESVTS